MRKRIDFQTIIDFLNSKNKEYELLSTEEYFNKECEKTRPSLVKLKFKCKICGKIFYRSYNNLFSVKNIESCPECGAIRKANILQDRNVYKVYKLTSIDTHKIYIGVTFCSLEKRWKKGEGYKTQKQIYNDILKYGWERFTKELLCECNSFRESREKEKYYIKYYNSLYPNGYNLNFGERPEKIDYNKEKIYIYNKKGELLNILNNIRELNSYTSSQKRIIRDIMYKNKGKTVLSYFDKIFVLESNVSAEYQKSIENIFFKKNGKSPPGCSFVLIQYDIDFNKINEFSSIRQATREVAGCKMTTLLNAIKKHRIYLNSYWEIEK